MGIVDGPDMVVAAMASELPGLLVLVMVVVVALSSLRCCDAEIKQLSIADDSRRFILFETFGVRERRCGEHPPLTHTATGR